MNIKRFAHLNIPDYKKQEKFGKYVKMQCLELDKNMKDFAYAIELPYNKLSKILNGYEGMPYTFEQRTETVFSLWKAGYSNFKLSENGQQKQKKSAR